MYSMQKTKKKTKKKLKIATLTSDIIDFKQEDIAIIPMYASEIRASKYTKQN